MDMDSKVNTDCANSCDMLLAFSGVKHSSVVVVSAAVVARCTDVVKRRQSSDL